MKGLIISMLVFIGTTAIMSTVTGLLAKSRLRLKAKVKQLETALKAASQTNNRKKEIEVEKENRKAVTSTADMLNNLRGN